MPASPPSACSLPGLQKNGCPRYASRAQAAIGVNRRDFDARYSGADRTLAAGRFTESMDALLEIIMPRQRDGTQLARQTYVAILELMAKPRPKAGAEQARGTLEVTGKVRPAPSDPVIDQYRLKLSVALF